MPMSEMFCPVVLLELLMVASYVLGGFSKALTVKNVWLYDPRFNSLEEVSSMTSGSMTSSRPFCKTGIFNSKIYVAGGVSRDRSSFLPLCSAEVFDPYTGQWMQLSHMPFLKAMNLPIAVLADMLRPMTTGMTTYKERLYVPQSLYSWPFFIDVGGDIYNPEMDSWSEMLTGMGDGWPATQAGTKLGVVVDGKIFALEPSTSLGSGVIKIYNDHEDAWEKVTPKIPLHDFTESQYLLAGTLGKLHVITKDEDGNILVLQADFGSSICPSFPPSISLAPPVNSPCEKLDTLIEEVNFWNPVSKNFGAADLVNCQHDQKHPCSKALFGASSISLFDFWKTLIGYQVDIPPFSEGQSCPFCYLDRLSSKHGKPSPAKLISNNYQKYRSCSHLL